MHRDPTFNEMSAMRNADTMLSLWRTCMLDGEQVGPRGQSTRELTDFSFSIDPKYPFMSFVRRAYDVEYFKKEMLWKLRADKFDDSIKQHAAMWAKVQNHDGSFNSNYGQYWFGEQRGFWHVVEELKRDASSRQAVIPMLNASHMTPETVDKVCTFGLGFRIRRGKLHMSVSMRSSDQIFGLGTDLPTFSFLYRMVHGALISTYPDLVIGDLNVTAISSHIYSRHYDMVHEIILRGKTEYQMVEMPWIDGMAEVLFLISTKGQYTYAPPEFKLANWLIGK
jgi:thymidylate synthase